MYKSIKLLFLLCALLGLQSFAYADCPDGSYHCPKTGATITYGKCYKFPASCNPCNSDYKKKCNNTLFNRWMSLSEVIQRSSLAEITIPGSHDAGMGKVTKCSDYAGSDVAKTQNRSFIQMLNSGTRYFDIRPIINKSGDMYLGHFSWIGKNIDIGIKTFTLRNEGCFGYSVDEMLDDVRTFVSDSDQGNSEVIILNFSHFMDFKKFDNKNSHFDQADFELLENKIKNKLNPYLVFSNKDFIDTKISLLTKDGAKVLVTFDTDGYEGADGIYSQKYLNLYDSYSNTNNYNKMKTDQFNKMSNYSKSKYFVLSWTLTQSENQAIGCMIPGNIGKPFGYDCKPIRDLASTANHHLGEVQNQVVKTKKYPNVIYTDYTSDEQTKIAISINGNK
jgi:hypothetical protein